MTIIYKKDFDYSFDSSACSACHNNCCIGEKGNIWVNQKEILEICDYLKINTIDFIQKYINKINNRYSIKDNPTDNSFECIFFTKKNNKCSIYPVKPIQCRKYPFWEYFIDHKEEIISKCPGTRSV